MLSGVKRGLATPELEHLQMILVFFLPKQQCAPMRIQIDRLAGVAPSDVCLAG